MSLSKPFALADVPASGYIWLPAPLGSTWRSAALPDGTALPSQYIKAPFANRDWDGLILTRVPEGAAQLCLSDADASAPAESAPFVYVEDGTLKFDVPGIDACMNDCVANWEAPGDDHRTMQNYVLMTARGEFYPFRDPELTVETISDGPLATVVRVYARLISTVTGRVWEGMTVCYDLTRFHDTELIQISACFDTPETPEQGCHFRFGRLLVDGAPFDTWHCGTPEWQGGMHLTETSDKSTTRLLQEEGQWVSAEHYCMIQGKQHALALVGGTAGLRPQENGKFLLFAAPDPHIHVLNEFTPAFAMTANLFYGEDARRAREWVGATPRLLRLTAGDLDTADAREAEGCVTIEAGDLHVTFAKAADGITLRDVYDAKTGRYVLRGAHANLFDAYMRELCPDGVMSPNIVNCAQLRLPSDRGWSATAIVNAGTTTQLLFMNAVKAPGVSITVTITADAARSRLSFDTAVTNDSADWTLLQMDYPRLSFDAWGKTSLFIPSGPGEVLENITDMQVMLNLHYSSWVCAMQYFAIWERDSRRGLYYGAHDPTTPKKHLFAAKESRSRRGYLGIDVPAEGIGEAKNSQRVPGHIIWQLYDGDWYDAAQIYREWVIHNAPWIPEMENGRRKDTPDWLYNTAVWLTSNVSHTGPDNGAWADEIIKLQKTLGVPVSCHLYNWHQVPFDTCYPHYFPVTENTMPGLAKLRAANIPYMPYINGRLWEIDDDEEYEVYTGEKLTRPYKSYGFPAATKNPFGDWMEERYGSRHRDGRPVRLNTMCPSTGRWQEMVKELCQRIFDEVGANAVYLDQLSCGEPPMCFDPSHPHRPGGGSWYVQNNWQMIDHLNEGKPAYGLFTSEDHAEYYTRHLQGYLVWHWARGAQVPAYPAVYGEYVTMFGRCYGTPVYDPTHMRILLGEQMCFGDQLGWNFHNVFNGTGNEDDISIVHDCAQLRYRFREYFCHGQLLRPPFSKCTGETVKAFDTPLMGIRYLRSAPAVAALRSDVTGKNRLLILVNITHEEQTLTLSGIDMPDGELTMHGALQGKMTVRDGCLTVTLPANTAAVGEYIG